MNNLISQFCDLIVLMMAHSLSEPTVLSQTGQRSSVVEQRIHKTAATEAMSVGERRLREVYGGKVQKWKRKSLDGYAKNLDKKWDNWFREMSK